MRERPILFNAPSVRAILNEQMTQTRRIITPQPRGELLQRGYMQDGRKAFIFERDRASWIDPGKPDVDILPCPYGQPGDRLWVRETWTEWEGVNLYRASYGDIAPRYCPWVPSIHMPRIRSRINLDIVSVRVERLQDISDDDARAEGVAEYAKGLPDELTEEMTRVDGYRHLWESINVPCSWDANPRVWVVEFRRVEKHE